MQDFGYFFTLPRLHSTLPLGRGGHPAMEAVRPSPVKGAVVMIDSASRRRIGAALLVLSLAAPLGASEPRPPSNLGLREAARTLLSFVGEVWEFLSSGSWSKNGGSLDPHGGSSNQPSGGSSSTSSDIGGSADPNG
jgi:hypothetical protein